MLKLLGLLVVLSGIFALGYYTGQRSAGELKDTIVDLSRNIQSVLNTMLGLERTLRTRESLVGAKARVIQAKSDLLERNFGNAARELREALDELEKTGSGEREGDAPAKVKRLIAKVRQAQTELESGKPVGRGRLDDIQKDLDSLLAS
jgi:uncharacterized coiled-coil DUF342 family protein